MKRLIISSLALLCLFGPTVLAQESQGSIFVVYYECDQRLESVLDGVVKSDIAPIVQRQIDAGLLTGWGWSSHVLGGKWRRHAWYAAANRDDVMDARAAIIQAVQAEASDAGQMLSAACPTHEDYLFTLSSRSTPLDAVSGDTSVSMSTYFQCDQSRVDRADEIMAEVLVPALERFVEQGDFTSWSYLHHDRGGLIRRAEVVRGADHKSLMNAYDQMMDEVNRDHADLTKEFLEICPSHEDYLWAPVIPE